MTDVLIDARRGAGSSLEILYGTVTWKPTLTHSRGTSIVLPAPTTYDLVDGQVVATNVQPSPDPVGGQVEWAYEVTFKDRHSKTYSFLVGVPDSTSQVNFIDLPRYFETKPPLFGQGPQGVPGESATVAVGTVAGGTEASVTNSGTNTDAVLDFVLPEGPQGPKGDGVTILDTTFVALPETYGNGTTIGSATVGNGWPVEGIVQTDKSSAISASQNLVSTDGLRVLQRTSNDGVWSAFKEFAWNDLATSTANGLMSSADKAKLTDLGILAFQSKSATDDPSTYPEGTSIGVFATSSGWPVVPGGSPSFTVVKTENPRTYNTATQWAYSYKTAGTLAQTSPALYRQGSSGIGWGEWQTVATREWVGEYVGTANVKDFGAVGDGVTDDTQAIQNALSSGAPTVFVPDGEYLISSSLRVYANTLFYTNSAKIKASDDFSDQQLINSFGTYSSSNDRELSVAVNAGARILTTKTAHPYQPGDTLRLVSQRVSTNPDDAGDDQLGWATINSNGAYFAEFVRVQEVPSPTTLKIDVGLLFNGYRPDNAQETDPFALSSAILRKTNGTGDNITIKGFELIGEAPHGIRCIRGINVRVENIKWVRHQAGKFIQFIDCAYAQAYKCEIESLQWFESDNGVDHAAINQYHVAGCWHTGFIECSSVRGTQPFDFTYASTAPYTSVWCYVRNSVTISCLHNPVTAHPGTYGIKVLDNDFQSCQRAGISIRSNRSEVRGNSVVGSGYADAPGIYLLEGGGKKSLISNNIVESFDTGLRINDGANKPFKEKIHTIFRGNTIRDFSTGFKITRMSGRPIPTAQQGIELVDNRFETSKTGAVGVVTCENGRGVRGLILKGNTFDFGTTTTSANTGIIVTANTKDLIVEDNIFTSVGTLVNYDNTGFLPGYGYDNILWVNSVRSFAAHESLPPDTANLQITYTGPRALVYIEADMNTMLSEKRFRMSSASAVSLGKGFPADNVTGWGEVVMLSSSTAAQKFYEESTAAPAIWTRRITPNGQSPWMKLSYTT